MGDARLNLRLARICMEALLQQCKIHGKAQEAVAALPVEDSLNYDCVKAAILCAYELVPEAYRNFVLTRKSLNKPT